jgi:hypothetical protein
MSSRLLEDLSSLDELIARQHADERHRELSILPARPKLVPLRARLETPARRVARPVTARVRRKTAGARRTTMSR